MFIDPSLSLRASISDYAAIGNSQTLALVSRFGSIDWWCLPQFASGSVFAALLDDERGGRFALTPRRARLITQRYIDRSNVVSTRFECDTGELELTDFMTMSDDAAEQRFSTHEIVRIARCTQGHVICDAHFAPRPDYARRFADLQRDGHGDWHWRASDIDCQLASSIEWSTAGADTLTATLRLERGEQRECILGAPARRLQGASLQSQAQLRLDTTLGWWRAWCDRCTYRGAYQDAVMRSCLALKLLTYRPSGAVVAAGTTSLPEGETGARNWDYRYCWLRDTSLVLQAFTDLGYLRESDDFLRWLLHATRSTQPYLQVLYDVHGETNLGEFTLPHLAGYHGIGPVRIGNDAHRQTQHDIYGEVILTAAEFVARGGQLQQQEKTLLAGFAEVVCDCWHEPDQGIWEVRVPPRHNTHSKLMCWAALDRILSLDRAIGLPIDATKIASIRQSIRADIERFGYQTETGGYSGVYGTTMADASLLLIPRLGYISANDPKMQATLRHIVEQLSVDGLLYRYPPSAGYDGVSGHEHLFAICNFWYVDCLARQGRLDEAHQLYERMLAFRNHVGLYAEEFDAKTGAPHGNFPQAFSHVGSITAALSLAEGGG